MTTFEDASAIPNRTSVYRVRAVNAVGASTYSTDATLSCFVGKLVVRQCALAFRNVRVGSALTQNVIVRNFGRGALVGNVGSLTGPLSVVSGGGEFSLGPGESRIVAIRFAPTVAGTVTQSLSITSSGPSPRSASVEVRGTAR